MPSPSLFPPVQAFFSRFSVVFKLAVIGFLILLLFIPLSMIESTLDERLERRNEAVGEITASWGGVQTLTGPVLQVPYRVRTRVWREQMVDGKPKNVEVEQVAVRRAFFLPVSLRVEGVVEPRKLYRGIYDAVVYNGTVTLAGEFAPPDFAALKIDPKEVIWEDAVVGIGVSDLRGARGQLVLEWAGRSVPMTPGSGSELLGNGVQVALRGMAPPSGPSSFRVDLTFNGSDRIFFTPLGIDTSATLRSSWPDPGFRGAFLPVSRSITPQGFDASWSVSYYGRGYSQQWVEGSGPDANTMAGSRFGVEFVSLIDFYRTTERAIKYAILFFVLIFTAFFLFELIGRLRIHPFQYILVGAALCLFYLLLLSVSEFLRFGGAYLLAAGATWAMVSLYSLSVLRSGARTLIVAGLLGVIFALLYVVLQLQDYSLLVGTVGLFCALGAVMFVTRRIDWYGAKEQERSAASAGPPPLP